MVKRYTYRYAEDGDLYRHEEPEGQYVLHSDYAALLARHNALVEAVKKEIRARNNYSHYRNLETAYDSEVNAARDELDAARDEVDRLIASTGAADCKGEG